MPDTRMERDSMGTMEVPAEALYGASTQRAVLNFPISTQRFGRRFIRALGEIKAAAAEVNLELGLLEEPIARAIIRAAREVATGRHDEHFVVDTFQTGSGTSTNMNANEVIANRAGQILGQPLGSRAVHPNDQVNLGQSSNDVIPTALHLSARLALHEALLPALEGLAEELEARSRDLWEVVKTGRTHLQDATPIRMGQVFLGFAGQVRYAMRRLRLADGELFEVALGGTAVGTGINTHPELAARVSARLSERLGMEVRETDNHFQAQSALDAALFLSGAVRGAAIGLMKVANDIRWMASGPRAGLGELELPEVQPGSSIMPGKVNPVIAEALIMAGTQVIANDQAVATSAQWGNFELNTMLPVAAHNLVQAIELLAAAAENFNRQCVAGLEATEVGPRLVEQGLAIATALAPVIGYDEAAKVAKEAARSGRTVREVAREMTGLTNEELRRILDPLRMVDPRLPQEAAQQPDRPPA